MYCLIIFHIVLLFILHLLQLLLYFVMRTVTFIREGSSDGITNSAKITVDREFTLTEQNIDILSEKITYIYENKYLRNMKCQSTIFNQKK